jgi:uncharacterized membrane protein YhhN
VGLFAALPIFLALVALALYALGKGSTFLFGFTKPIATLSLLLVSGIPMHDRFGALIVVGLAFSALGDIALLSERTDAFLLGLILFLVAHLGYAAAFLGGGKTGLVVASASALAGFAVVAAASTWVIAQLWPNIDRGLRMPALAYTVAISVMVGASYLVLAGPWPERLGIAAVTGAVLFYLSDVVLAWNRFRSPVPRGDAFALGLYWAGQLGIALAARWGTGG